MSIIANIISTTGIITIKNVVTMRINIGYIIIRIITVTLNVATNNSNNVVIVTTHVVLADSTGSVDLFDIIRMWMRGTPTPVLILMNLNMTKRLAGWLPDPLPGRLLDNQDGRVRDSPAGRMAR